MAERQLPKLNVAGSIPVSRSSLPRLPPQFITFTLLGRWREPRRSCLSAHRARQFATGQSAKTGCLLLVRLKRVIFQRLCLRHKGQGPGNLGVGVKACVQAFGGAEL